MLNQTYAAQTDASQTDAAPSTHTAWHDDLLSLVFVNSATEFSASVTLPASGGGGSLARTMFTPPVGRSTSRTNALHRI